MKSTLTTIIIILFYTNVTSQVISSVNAYQNDNTAVITYNFNAGEPHVVSLYYSEDGGKTYQGSLKKVIGDAGNISTIGIKKIVWDVLAERDILFNQSIIFRIEATQKFGYFTDSRDGKTYKTVRIGDQIWMAENLDCYSKSKNNSAYGRYYNYNQAETACPDGWRLPSSSDFYKLLNNLGNPVFIYNSIIAGGESGFDALLAGCAHQSGGIMYVGKWAIFWCKSSPEYDGITGNNWYKNLSVGSGKTTWDLSTSPEKQGNSVRCISNNSKSINYHSDSEPTSFVISKANQPIVIIPVEVYVKKYVTEKVEQWQLKGEYEKTIDYQKRVNEKSREQKIQQFTNEALSDMKKEFTNSINWNNFTLSQYDADNEAYLIQSNELGQLAIPVPVSDAQNFKQNWSSIKISGQDYYVNNNKLVLAKLIFTNPTNGKKYLYDSKQPTTYAANNISYNFKPIEVNVKQDILTNNTKLTENKTVVGSADVDINIPLNQQINDKTFVVIIANENYTREVKVQYALNDGKIFKEYCEKTLGIPSNNIHFTKDATFGSIKSEIKWISDVAQAFNGQAKLIFYYAGHGMPNESDKSAYILPVDGFSSDFETAIKLEDLYNRLTTYSTQNVTIFLDACFSGSIRDNGMLASARGVKIRPKTDILKGKIVVFSAASGEETAYPFSEKQHGLFTYFLLKKLQETKGNIDYQTLSNYIVEKVKQQSIVVNQKSQTPQIIVSPEIQNTWQIMKIK